MALIFKGTEYNVSNTKNINYKGNEVNLLAYATKVINVNDYTGSSGITGTDGITTYNKTLKLIVEPYADIVTFEDLNLGMSYNINNYNANTGELNVTIIGTKANQNFTAKAYSKEYIWAKPYNFELWFDDGLDVSVQRVFSYEKSAGMGQLELEDIIYHGDVLEVNVEVYDDLIVKPYPSMIIVDSDINLGIQVYQEMSKSISAKSGTIIVNVNGFDYYSASGKMNIGVGAIDISLTGMNSTFNYNETTGVIKYTLYSTKPNTTVTATLKYKI